MLTEVKSEQRPQKRHGISASDPKLELKIASILSKLGLRNGLDIRELQAASLLSIVGDAKSYYVVAVSG